VEVWRHVRLVTLSFALLVIDRSFLFEAEFKPRHCNLEGTRPFSIVLFWW
jgi:hypothetical protein